MFIFQTELNKTIDEIQWLVLATCARQRGGFTASHFLGKEFFKPHLFQRVFVFLKSRPTSETQNSKTTSKGSEILIARDSPSKVENSVEFGLALRRT